MIERRNRIVVTGMGTVNPLGLLVPQSWEALIKGQSGIDYLNPPIHSEVKIAGQVKDFDFSKYCLFPDQRKEMKRIHRSAQFAYVVALEAMRDAGLWDEKLLLQGVLPERIGLRIGSGMAGADYIAKIEDDMREKGDQKISPSAIFRVLPERPATVTGRWLGIKGPAGSSVAACATGSQNIIDAVRIMKDPDSKVEVMLAGGTEAAISPIGLTIFDQIRALSRRHSHPDEVSCPFDELADGFVMGEGAGAMVLEKLGHALDRKAEIHAEVVGYTDNSDAFHDTEPDVEGASKAMTVALEQSGINSAEVDYINTHGTSTVVGGRVELTAIRKVFRSSLDRLLISSTKSATGHLMGATGALEAIFCVLAICKGIVPPTLNLHHPIKEADGMDLVPLVARYQPVKIALSNSFGFGGLNNTLIFREFAQ